VKEEAGKVASNMPKVFRINQSHPIKLGRNQKKEKARLICPFEILPFSTPPSALFFS
jgi:hypothetical protein